MIQQGERNTVYKGFQTKIEYDNTLTTGFWETLGMNGGVPPPRIAPGGGHQSHPQEDIVW